MSESTSAWLSVSQAAAALGISERQARRYAGRLAPDDRREAGHEAGLGAGHATGALVRLEAMAAEREKATGHAQSTLKPDITPDAKGLEPDMGPDASPIEAGLEPDAKPDVTLDTSQSTLAVELLRESLEREREQNAFLRGVIEAQNRDAAELRAALREALKISSRALLESTSPGVDDSRVERLEPLKKEASVPSSKSTSAAATGPAPIEAQAIEATAEPKYFERSKGLRAWLLKVLRG